MLPKLKQIWSGKAEKPSPPVRIVHPEVGTVTLNRSVRAKRISLSVKASGEVKLTFPTRVSRQKALEFLDSKTDWVLHTRQRLQTAHPKRVISQPFSTREHTLCLAPENTDTIRTTLHNHHIVVSYPSTLPVANEDVQQAVKRGIEEAWRREAKGYLPQRLEQLSRLTGLRYGKVSIRNAKTRWGSCSARDDISLSLHLMKLPDHLIDYILLHELCHTKHKNHGPDFHALLDRLTGGKHLLLRRQLKDFHITR